MIQRAWEICIGGRFYAIPIGQSIELLAHIQPTPIPAAVAHCNSILRWQDHILPVLELAKLWQIKESSRQHARHAWLIVGWEYDDKHLHTHANSINNSINNNRGCLAIHSAPRRVQVLANMACPIPIDEPLADVACGCFHDGVRAVVVLHCASLFTTLICKKQ